MIELDESKRLDINYLEAHGDLYPLMKNAGKAVYETIKDFYGGGRNILFICGPGNNGGDGFIAAALLGVENRVRIVLLTGGKAKVGDMPEKAMSEIKNASIIKNPSKNVIQEHIKWSEIIVDSLLGTGARGELSGDYASTVEIINRSGKPIISVDIPTGFGNALQVIPKMTVSFTDSKEGMKPENSGEIVIKSIGIGKDLLENAGAGEIVFFPEYEKNTHKGMNGRLIMIAGWAYHGSGIIASRAAMAALPDLVNVVVPDNKYTTFSSSLHEQIVHSYSKGIMTGLLENATGAVVGPGMGYSALSREVMSTVSKSGVNLVLDAEAIRMAGENEIEIRKGMVFTPHSAEFKLLTGMEPNRENAEKFALDRNCVILLKGPTDIITTGEKTILSHGGSPRMAMGGTGDLLAGLTGGFISRGMSPFRSAALASFICKRNGEDLEKYSSYWFGIDELIANLNPMMRKYYAFAKGTGNL